MMLTILLTHYVPIFSDATFYELADQVSTHPKIVSTTSPELRREYLLSLQELGEFVEPAVQWRGCRDPKDDKFLDVACAVQARAILSGDKDLLILESFRGIPILSPNAFLEREGLC